MHVEQQRVNPLSVIEEFDIGQETNRFIGDIQVNIAPVNKLTINYIFGLDTYSLQGHTLQPRLPYGPVAATFFPDGYVSFATSNVFLINNDINATYQTNISSRIESTTTAGGTLQYDKTRFTSAEGRDLSPFVETIKATGNFFQNPDEVRTERSIWGYFLQQTFGLDDRLFLTLAGRIDGSSAFGEDQRNQFYPKVSSSFVLSETGFWENNNISNFWNTLKLRASYGEAGNLTGIGPFDRFSNFDVSVITGANAIIRSGTLGNPDVEPERQKEFEIGTDMAFLNGRIGAQFTYYHQDIEDLLLTRSLASSSGGTTVTENVGSMTNKGIEFLIDAFPFRSQDFSWNISLLFSSNENEVKDIGLGRAGLSLRGGGGTQSAIDGESLGVFFGVDFARDENGELLLSPLGLPQVERGNDETGEIMRDEDGQPTGTPIRFVLGDPNPDYTASLINEFKYKKFNLRLQFDAVQGFEVFNWNVITSNNVGASPLSERELRGELPRGWVAAIGGFIGPRIQRVHVEDGSFVKLREVALSYNLGDLGPLTETRISFIGRNLVSFDDYSGFDPETNSAGQSSRVRGDDFGNVPIPRFYQLSFTTSF